MEERGRKLTRIEHTKFWLFVPKILHWVIIVTASIVTLIVFSETVLRLFKWANFNGYEELLIMVAFWLYMIGCAHGSFEKSQIKADIVEIMLKESAFKDIIRVLREVLTVVLSVWFTVWAFNLIIYAISIGSVTSVYRIPMVFGFTSIFVGVGFMTFYNIVYMIGEMKKLYFRRVKHIDVDQWMAEHGLEGGAAK
jgi:TRAP-type C4-dicarboxylate transport system permease small subunit